MNAKQKRLDNKKKFQAYRKVANKTLRAENDRLRWELNEQTQYADEYHAAMNVLWEKVGRMQDALKEVLEWCNTESPSDEIDADKIKKALDA